MIKTVFLCWMSFLINQFVSAVDREIEDLYTLVVEGPRANIVFESAENFSDVVALCENAVKTWQTTCDLAQGLVGRLSDKNSYSLDQQNNAKFGFSVCEGILQNWKKRHGLAEELRNFMVFLNLMPIFIENTESLLQLLEQNPRIFPPENLQDFYRKLAAKKNFWFNEKQEVDCRSFNELPRLAKLRESFRKTITTERSSVLYASSNWGSYFLKASVSSVSRKLGRGQWSNDALNYEVVNISFKRLLKAYESHMIFFQSYLREPLSLDKVPVLQNVIKTVQNFLEIDDFSNYYGVKLN